MYDFAMIILGVVLTLGTALFVAAEFSLVALDPAAVDQRVAAGDKRAKQIRYALHHLSTNLSGAQVGITLTTILLGYTTQTSLTKLLTGAFGHYGWINATATATAVIIAAVFVNVFSMIFGELVPKNMALADTFKTAGLVSSAMTAFTTICKPLIVLLNSSANAVLKIFGIKPSEHISSARSPAELASLVRHSAEEGTLDMSTANMLTKSIGLSNLSAVDVMTDRGRMVTLDEDETAADIVALASRTGHSRFPVVGDDIDDIVGVVNLRRAVAVPYERRQDVVVTSSSLMSEAPRVPETMQLATLLLELREAPLQMAIVVDEYGGTAGVVTLEDVIEEIVGEVADEHDQRRRGIRVESEGVWLVPGTLRPDEVAERIGIVIPEDGPYETVGGFIMNHLGRIPEEGDELEIPGVYLKVRVLSGRRIETVEIRQLPTGGDDE